ncbi:putative Nuclease HARBI1 [Daphnia magna]|uniref:Putative nuclease HARBI1 n=1 Tax=Daphnia magna TaxID=35525 RepID=A0A162SCQ4_9CRUS|nr:putative Nuclease HARBI1 [Daphnia magna]
MYEEFLYGQQLYKTFHFDRQSLQFIEVLISERLERKLNGRKSRTPMQQLLAALNYYATDTFQKEVGYALRMSQSSVCRSVHDVSNALCSIAQQWILFPRNLNAICVEFAEFAGFRGIIGAIDGSHIKLQRTWIDERIYVNRKNFHSINVQAICDANGKVLSIYAKKPLSTNDAAMFLQSAIGQRLARGDFSPFHFIGDSGYACTPYLLTPYAAPITEGERRYNVAHKKSRCIIERLFRMVKRRFPSLFFGIRMQPGRACRVIMACFVLHNIALSRRQPDFDDEGIVLFKEEEYDNQPDRQENLAKEILRLQRQGFAKRQRVTLNDFSR